MPGAILRGLKAIKNSYGKAKTAERIENANEGGKLNLVSKFMIITTFSLIIGGLFVWIVIFAVLYNIYGATDAVGTAFENSGDDSTENVNVEVGDAAQFGNGYEAIQKKIDWLWDGNGVPETEQENQKYLTEAEFEYLDSDGHKQKKTLTVHKKIAAEAQQIFKEMMKAGFKLEWESGGGTIRGWEADKGYGGDFYRSAHCYGLAFDINVAANCYKASASAGCSVGNEYNPTGNPFSFNTKIVKIWEKHGFDWGGNWTSPIDYMHMSYVNH